MGLSISVYHNLKEVEEDEDHNFDFKVYQSSPEWYDRCPNLSPHGCYNGDKIYGIYPSYAYGSHSNFRNTLLFNICEMNQFNSGKNYDVIDWEKLDEADPKTIPFYKFIVFSDCEGVIDWEVSKEILEDFKKYEHRLETIDDDPLQHLSKTYWKWKNAFQEAVDNKGVVVFS